MTDRLTVVGGGIGGLTAAIAAAEAGWPVRLLEAKATLGGRAWTTDGPYRANWGPHVVYGDGPLWAWLDERDLIGGVAHAPLVPRLRVRVGGHGRRPPASLFLAARRLTRADAPVERTFRAWAVELVGERDAHRLAAFLGVATFDHDPGRLSAAFANDILRRATAFPPTVRYFPGGWATLVDRLAEHARGLGVEIETGAHVGEMPAAPVVLAVPPPVAATLLDDATVARVTGTTTALLDVGLRRWRTDPYVLSDLDAPGFCETFTVVDPSLAPSGQHLVQTQTGLRPGEELAAAVARLESLLDAGYDHWRARETWRRRARVHHETGALDRPGTTWRDRPAVDRGDGVWLVNDFAAAPGLLSEVSHRAALAVVDGLGTPRRAVRPVRTVRAS